MSPFLRADSSLLLQHESASLAAVEVEWVLAACAELTIQWQWWWCSCEEWQEAWEEVEEVVVATEVAEDVEVLHHQMKEETHLLSNRSDSHFELKFETKHFGDKKNYGEKWKAKN